LRLQRVPFAEPSLFTFCKTGVDFEPTPTGLKVIEVVPGSSAEEQSLQIGDMVVSINGLAVSKDNFGQALDQGHGPAGTKIKLEVKRGDETRSVEVEKRMLL
jgi:C-terminal processing protease CtpA/Prc